MAGSVNLLERFIPKIELIVIDNLTYLDAIHLSQVNRYFHSIINLEQWPIISKRLSMNSAQK